MTESGNVAPAVTYMFDCPSCRSSFDAAAAALCQCLTPVNTPVCPSCERCLCELPKEFLRGFWSGAPEALWQKRLHKAAPAPAGQAPPVSPTLKRPLVLVADDEPTTRLVATRLLEKLGCGFLVAADGQEALKMVREARPDLVLTDALMPKLGGREMARMIKEDPDTASIKVILMTSIYTKEQYKNEALLKFRCDGYLKKPVSAEDLRKLLDLEPPQAPRPS